MDEMYETDDISYGEDMLSLAYTALDSVGCTATLLATLAGSLIITTCPVNNAPNSTVTVAAKATNTGNINNNSFVIGVTIARADNGAIVKSANSGNLDIVVGAYKEWSTTFTMPTSNVNVSFDLQADSAFNY